MLNFIALWRNEHIAVRELSQLPDNRLADLGIARADIKAVARAAASGTHANMTEGESPRWIDAVDDMAPSWATHNRRALA